MKSMNYEQVKDFLNVLIGNMGNKNLPISYYVISIVAVLIFFAIRDFAGKDKKYVKENIGDLVTEAIIGIVTSVILLYIVDHVLISVILGCIVAIWIYGKLPSVKKPSSSKTEDKKDDKKNDVNVNIKVDTDTKKEEKLLPEFYDPQNLKLPEDITTLNQLNIIMILEMYGYISPNQKFKMITSSLFDTPDDQVERLLEMYALEEKELKEARAILNLIKLKNRLITKEEALKAILEAEQKQAQKGEKQ